MIGNIPASVSIGAQVLKDRAKGDSPEARFKEIIKPANIAAGCFMCGNEDEEFRAAVGGLILSYDTDSPEQKRIIWEMQQIQRFSTMIQAAQLGMGIPDFPETPEGCEPIGLMGLWHSREKR